MRSGTLERHPAADPELFSLITQQFTHTVKVYS